MAKTKKDALRQINVKPEVQGGGSLIEQTQIIAPPAIDVGRIPSPNNLTLLSTTPARNTQSPMAYINIDWNPPINVTPEYYEIEYGKQSDWTGSVFNNPQRVRAYTSDAALLADANTAFYVRVRAVYRSVVSNWTDLLSVTTAIDTSAPANFTSSAAAFQNGNLVATWSYTNTPDNFKHAKIIVWNAGRTVSYGTFYNSTGRFVWTEAENLQATAGAGVTNVSVDIIPVSWANTDGTTNTYAATSSAPSNVTSLGTDFTTGDLTINWTNPTNAPFKHVEIKIYREPAKTNLYRTITTQSDRVTWTVDQNFADTTRIGGSPIPDPSVTVDVRVVGWLNQASAISSATATKTVPSAPTTLVSTWDSDDGSASADLIFTWTAASFVKDYEVSINGVVRGYVTDLSYLYTYAENVKDNIAAGDPTLSISIKSRDRLNQLSTGALTGTLTNSAVGASLFSVTYAAGFSSVGGVITFTKTIKDFKSVVWTVKSGVTTVKTAETDDNVVVIVDLPSGTYTLEAQIKDVFDQLSVAEATTSFIIDALTVEDLRKEAKYSDSIGTADSALKPVLADNNTLTSGMTYALSASYRWTQVERPLIDRYKTITAGLFNMTSGTATIYFATSTDGSTWSWFAGPITTPSYDNSQGTLTSVANEAAAQAAAISVTSAGTIDRWDLPSITEARYIRIYHRHTTQSLTIREFYPRRLVQSDDIEAESIKSINLAVGSVIADRISVTTLAAIQTSTGTLTIDSGGHIKSGMTAWNTGTGYYLDNNGGTPRLMIGQGNSVSATPTRMYWDGTSLVLEGGGVIVKTAASNQRVELNSTGLYGYNSSSVEQFKIQSSDGKAVAGAGNVTLDASGITIKVSDSFEVEPNTLNFKNNLGARVGGFYVYDSFPSNTFGEVQSTVFAASVTGKDTYVRLSSSSTALARTELSVSGGGGSASFAVSSSSGGGKVFRFEGTYAISRTTVDREIWRDSNDGYLRLNNANNFASGVLLGGSVTVTDFVYVSNSSSSPLLAILGGTNSGSGDQTFLDIRRTSALAGNIVINAFRSGVGGTTLELNTGNSGPVYIARNFSALCTPVANQNRIVTTGDTSGHYPLVIMKADNSTVSLEVKGDLSYGIRGTWTNISDRRIKKAVKPIESALNRVLQWNPVSFKFTDRDDQSTHLGFIAQEMLEVSPDLVRFSPTPPDLKGKKKDDDGFYSVNYSEAVAELAAALKEMYKELQEVKASLK